MREFLHGDRAQIATTLNERLGDGWEVTPGTLTFWQDSGPEGPVPMMAVVLEKDAAPTYPGIHYELWRHRTDGRQVAVRLCGEVLTGVDAIPPGEIVLLNDLRLREYQGGALGKLLDWVQHNRAQFQPMTEDPTTRAGAPPRAAE